MDDDSRLIPITKLVTLLLITLVCILAAFAGGYILRGMSDGSSLTFIDDYGRTVELDGHPERIVSIAPTPTEILFAVGAGNLVVGVDDYSDYPEEVLDLPKVGSYELNLEAIIGLSPDLIISSDLVPQAQLDAIEQQGIQYIILATRTMDDVFKDIQLIGSITGQAAEAETLVAQLRERVDALTAITLVEEVVQPKVYLEYYPLWTFGPGSFGHDLIELAGGKNIAENASAEYVTISDEFVIAHNPEIIVYSSGVMTDTTAEDISSRPGWNQIDAVENDRIYSIDDDLISRYGPRIVDGLEELARLLHPELFPG